MRRDPLDLGNTTLLGPLERASLLRTFDACAARGGREGDEVERFEDEFATATGARHAIAVSSCTAGLQLLLLANGIGPGDEVIVPAYTFAATIHAVLHARATPVFADVEPETLCLDADAVAQRVTERTVAILVVHMGGKSADLSALRAVADPRGILLLEDAAQAHGTMFDGRPVGPTAGGGAFSFSPKLMTSFRGGAIVANDDQVADRCRRLRFHGLPSARAGAHDPDASSLTQEFVHAEPGFSLMMTPIQAGLLLPQVAQLGERFAHRHENGRRLAAGLADIPGLHPVEGLPRGRSNYYTLEVFYAGGALAGLGRDDLAEALAWEGVPVSPVPLTKNVAYTNPSLRSFAYPPYPVADSTIENLLVFGHPLQSLALSAPPEVIDDILDRVACVVASAGDIAKFLT